MGVLFVDSFDHYTSLPGKWNGSSGVSISAGNGRFTTAGLYAANETQYIYKSFASRQTIWLGFGIKWMTSGSFYTAPICFKDGGISGTTQVVIKIESNGVISAYRGSTLLGSSTYVLSREEWHHMEVYVKIDNSAGEITVRVDEAAVLTLTSQDTQASGNATFDIVGFNSAGWGSGSPAYYDDVYMDSVGFKGDCRVQCIVPTGAGNYAQWTPSAGNNWAAVDEKPPDTADYVGAGTAGLIDSYVVENLIPTGGTVHAVAGNFYCQKTDAGARTLAIATRLGGTDDAGSGIAVPSSWGFIQDIKETKPGGGAWTVTDVNNAEMGQKMIA